MSASRAVPQRRQYQGDGLDDFGTDFIVTSQMKTRRAGGRGAWFFDADVLAACTRRVKRRGVASAMGTVSPSGAVILNTF
jgi:hypothetical protein